MEFNLKNQLIVLGILLITFLGGYFVAVNQIKNEFVGEIEHLKETLMSKDSLIQEYKTKFEGAVENSIVLRDSLQIRIQEIIENKKDRIVYRNPKIPQSTEDEILDRVREFLVDPEKY